MYSKEVFSTDIPMSSRKFRRILDFYIFHCPVEGRSIRATTFDEQGWKDKLFSTLKKEMLSRASSSLKQNYHPCERSELCDYFKTVDLADKTDEYCVFLKHDEKRVMESLYAAIRNAFAHGSFLVKKRNRINMYYFVNHEDYTKAKIQLREETLLNWIDTFQSQPELIKRAHH